MSLKISLTQISEYLNECIDMRKDIPEEVLSEFVFQIADKAAAHSVTVSSAYFDLKESCQKYKEFHTDDPATHFACMTGMLLGTMDLYSAIQKKEQVQTTRKWAVDPDSKQYEVLNAIQTEPGISHRELLEKLQSVQTTSALSHLTKKLEDRDFISSIKGGRTKYYYITLLGESALERSRKSASSTAEHSEEAASMELFFEAAPTHDLNISDTVHILWKRYKDVVTEDSNRAMEVRDKHTAKPVHRRRDILPPFTARNLMRNNSNFSSAENRFVTVFYEERERSS